MGVSVLGARPLWSLALFLVLTMLAGVIEGWEQCPRFVDSVENTTLNPKDVVKSLYEVSGVAVSRKRTFNGRQIMYAINDSGKGLQIAVYDLASRQRVQSFKLAGVEGISNDQDWEDLAVGPCAGNTDVDCIYIANTGDNVARESEGKSTDGVKKSIIRVVEPALRAFENPAVPRDIDPATVAVMPISYLHVSSPTKYCDVEALFVDSRGDELGGEKGDVYLVSKWSTKDSARTRVFRYPAQLQPADGVKGAKTYDVVAVVTSRVNPPEGLITRAAMSADGATIAIGSRNHTRFYQRNDRTVASSINNACAFTLDAPSVPDAQFESISFVPGGLKVVEVSECPVDVPCQPPMAITTLLDAEKPSPVPQPTPTPTSGPGTPAGGGSSTGTPAGSGGNQGGRGGNAGNFLAPAVSRTILVLSLALLAICAGLW